MKNKVVTLPCGVKLRITDISYHTVIVTVLDPDYSMKTIIDGEPTWINNLQIFIAKENFPIFQKLMSKYKNRKRKS